MFEVGETVPRLKAIETEYNDYRFRSRLEARWAVFFDVLNLQYVYEMEGYDLGELGWYLPDFWFPDLSAFGEVKPKTFTRAEYDKAATLPYPCLLFDTPEARAIGHYPAGLSDYSISYKNYLDNSNYWHIILESSVCKKRLWFCFYDTEIPTWEFYLENKAECLAKQARFEHGERPRI